MACLNLPKDIWYKPKNLYLAGIIPGPKQPSLENLNHYLWPLINDLVPVWDQGIQFSRMANHSEGRLTRSAIALVICDLPTAHHVAAFASIGSHFFCSACNCYHKTNYARVDFQNWVLCDKDELHQYAEQWKDATTSAKHEWIFKEYGVHYLKLWWLPYWDPARQIVINSMYCILEGLVQHHTHNLLRLTTGDTTATNFTMPAFHFDFQLVNLSAAECHSMNWKEIVQVSDIHRLLTSPMSYHKNVQVSLDGLRESLISKNTHALVFVSQSLGCIPIKNSKKLKADYAKALVEWVSNCHHLSSSI